MFHTPPHKVAPHLPQAGTIDNDVFADIPGVIVNPSFERLLDDQPDVRANDHGSVWILTPISAAGSAWFAEHLPNGAPRWGGGVAVEARFVHDIVTGLRDDGLKVA